MDRNHHDRRDRDRERDDEHERARSRAGAGFYNLRDAYGNTAFGQAGYRATRPQGREAQRDWERAREPQRWPEEHRFAENYDEGRWRERPRESHYGRGPRGYKRSDERIRDDVSDRFYADHDIDASDLEVRVSGGVVTLEGKVESRGLKRYAEDLAMSVLGVVDVVNHLSIER